MKYLQIFNTTNIYNYLIQPLKSSSPPPCSMALQIYSPSLFFFHFGKEWFFHAFSGALSLWQWEFEIILIHILEYMCFCWQAILQLGKQMAVFSGGAIWRAAGSSTSYSLSFRAWSNIMGRYVHLIYCCRLFHLSCCIFSLLGLYRTYLYFLLRYSTHCSKGHK